MSSILGKSKVRGVDDEIREDEMVGQASSGTATKRMRLDEPQQNQQTDVPGADSLDDTMDVDEVDEEANSNFFHFERMTLIEKKFPEDGDEEAVETNRAHYKICALFEALDGTVIEVLALAEDSTKLESQRKNMNYKLTNLLHVGYAHFVHKYWFTSNSSVSLMPVSIDQLPKKTIRQMNDGKIANGTLLACEGIVFRQPQNYKDNLLGMLIAEKSDDGKVYKADVVFPAADGLLYTRGQIVRFMAKLNNGHHPILHVQGEIQILGTTSIDHFYSQVQSFDP